MAEIDKGLPNTRTKLEVPSQEEIEEVSVQEPQEEKGPIEVIPEEDGGATLDFEPGAINVPGTENHFDNLADILPDDILEPIGQKWMQRKDALLAACRLQELLRACAVSYQDIWLEQALDLWNHLDEPMIDEQMYRSCFIQDKILHTPFVGEENTWIRFVLRKRLTRINEGAVVHSSLWNKNLSKKWLTIPTVKDWIQQENLSIN